MRIARLLIYEGEREDLEKHFAITFVQPGTAWKFPNSTITVHEDPATGAGGRVQMQDGEVAAIKLVR